MLALARALSRRAWHPHVGERRGPKLVFAALDGQSLRTARDRACASLDTCCALPAAFPFHRGCVKARAETALAVLAACRMYLIKSLYCYDMTPGRSLLLEINLLGPS